MDDLVRSYAEGINATYGGMLKIDHNALDGIEVDHSFFSAPEMQVGKARQAAYDVIFSNPENVKVPVKAMAEEYIHAFTNEAAPNLVKRYDGSAKSVDLFKSPANFIVEGIGQLYAPYIKHVGNKELVKAVKGGNTAAIERLRNSPHTLGYIIMDTMSRAFGRKEALDRAAEIDSAELLLVHYAHACRTLGEPAVNFMKGADKLIFEPGEECP